MAGKKSPSKKGSHGVKSSPVGMPSQKKSSASKTAKNKSENLPNDKTNKSHR